MISPPTMTTHRPDVPVHRLSRRQLIKHTGAFVAAGLVSGVMGACSRGNTATQRTGREPSTITVLSSFGTFGRDAYLWVAKAKGFYDEAGITVDIQPGAGTGSNISAMAAGAAHFASFDAMGGILAHGAQVVEGGDGAGIRLLALAQQRTLAAFLTLDPDITDPRDFAGRTVAVAPGGGTALLLPTWLQHHGVDPGRVEVVHFPPPELIPVLVQGVVDVADQYVVGVPMVEAAAGRTPTVFPIGDTLSDALGVGIWAAEDVAQKWPDLCRRFRDATLKGLAYALEHPDEAGQILHQADPTSNPDHAAEELRLMQPYTFTAPNTPLGAVTTTQLARAIALLEATSAIPAGTTPDDLADPDQTDRKSVV